jgi:hypothetical protein
LCRAKHDTNGESFPFFAFVELTLNKVALEQNPKIKGYVIYVAFCFRVLL